MSHSDQAEQILSEEFLLALIKKFPLRKLLNYKVVIKPSGLLYILASPGEASAPGCVIAIVGGSLTVSTCSLASSWDWPKLEIPLADPDFLDVLRKDLKGKFRLNGLICE